ncbi:MAG: type II secretion system minor pseudopilin GspJ [Gammaproteobacteria bacterium]
MKHHSRGFTLIEILVATAILALLAIMAYGSLGTILQERARTRRAGSALQSLQMTMLFMSQDLAQAAPRPIRSSTGVLKPALHGGAGTAGPLLVLTRDGDLNPAEEHRSDLERVGYGLRHHALVRYTWPVLDRVTPLTPERETLLHHVRSFKIRFLGPQGNWHRHWPALDAALAAELNRRPIGIKIILKTKTWGTIERIFELP